MKDEIELIASGTAKYLASKVAQFEERKSILENILAVSFSDLRIYLNKLAETCNRNYITIFSAESIIDGVPTIDLKINGGKKEFAYKFEIDKTNSYVTVHGLTDRNKTALFNAKNKYQSINGFNYQAIDLSEMNTVIKALNVDIRSIIDKSFD